MSAAMIYALQSVGKLFVLLTLLWILWTIYAITMDALAKRRYERHIRKQDRAIFNNVEEFRRDFN